MKGSLRKLSLSRRSSNSSSSLPPHPSSSRQTSFQVPAELIEPGVDPAFARAEAQLTRSAYYNKVKHFVNSLSAVSNQLRELPEEARRAQLSIEIAGLNAQLASRPNDALLYLPMLSASAQFAGLVRITPGEERLLNSADRTPYMIYLESIRYASPLFPSSTHIHLYSKKLGTFITHLSNSLFLASSRCSHCLMVVAATVPDPSTRRRIIREWSNDHPPTSSSSLETKRGSDSTSDSSSASDSSPSHSDPPRIRTGESSRRQSSWQSVVERIRRTSPYGRHPGWGMSRLFSSPHVLRLIDVELSSIIVKYGDDCRQERLALQLVRQFAKVPAPIFASRGLW